MSEHTMGNEPTLPAVEPASITEITRIIVALLVALGVFNIDDAFLDVLTLVLGGLISIGMSWWTRSRVTPTAKPRTNTGVPLVSATPSPPPQQP